MTPGHISGEKHDLKGYMHPRVHCSAVYNGHNMEATKCPSTEEWIKMWVIYTVECYSVIKKNEIMAFAAT